jgi:hypothetical protein
MKGVMNIIALGCLALGCFNWASGDDRVQGTNMVALLASPDKFDGKVVSVLGFLVLDHQKHHAAAAFLFLHEEDANNILSNGFQVVPNEQMIRDEEKIDRMYILLTGTVKLVPTEGDSRALVLKDIRSCRVWSDPKHPLGMRENETRPTDNK